MRTRYRLYKLSFPLLGALVWWWLAVRRRRAYVSLESVAWWDRRNALRLGDEP